MRTWHRFVMMCILFCFPFFTSTATLQEFKVPIGSKVFVTKMEMNLDTFIIAEIQKQNIPLRVVLNEAEANYIITGVVQKTSRSTAGAVFGSVVVGENKFEADAHLISVKSKELIWSGNAGDRSVVFSVLRRGGQRKVAKKIVKQLHKDLFVEKVKVAKPPKPSTKPVRAS